MLVKYTFVYLLMGGYEADSASEIGEARFKTNNID